MVKTERLADLPWRHVAPRPVDVWLPPGYSQDESTRYPVLYMHDGQNLFDPRTASNGVTWGVAEALAALIAAGRARPAIIVGVWHGEQRWPEYIPQRPLETPLGRRIVRDLRPQLHGAPHSDAYLRFLVEELKPAVDARYRTRPGQPDTLVMGSSMGGLISLYALCEYPQVFGGAGCLSTHWPPVAGVILDYLVEKLPPPGAHRLYFDYGTETLDANYEPHQQRVDAVVAAAGYGLERDWLTRRFEEAEHSERSWQERVHIPLAFLLGSGG